MYTSQSQLIESILDRLFPAPGFFLEIGAWDGELISQTAYLERERGWRGVCVDPFPRNFQHRAARVCARALSADGQPRPFLRVTVDRRYGGNVSYFSGFRDTLQAGPHWPLIQEHCTYAEVEVPTITPAQLWRSYDLPDYIEFLSLDTEGSELEILESIDFTRRAFGLIMVEHNRDEPVREATLALLEPHGYVRLEEMVIDDVYVEAGRRP